MSVAEPPVPDLETPRTRLRRWGIADAPSLHRAFGDAATMTYWDSPPSSDVAETERHIRASLDRSPMWHAAWAVLRKDREEPVGMVNYHARQPLHGKLAVGWILVPGERGHGWMAEAMPALLGHCFGALETHRVEAEIEPENERSLSLARRLGFRREGLFRDRLRVGGVFRTVEMWSLLRPEWVGGRQE